MPEIIDTHCHLDDELFNTDREAILARCYALGIHKIVVPSIHRDNWDTVLQLCNQHDALFPALGLHPLFVEKHSPSDIDDLQEYLDNNHVVAIGEIGLDFYNKDTDRDRQVYFLQQQLQVAEKYQLPVLLHIRKAHNDILTYLKKYRLCGGIAHAFNGSVEQAREYIKLGFKLGFGGVITYAGSTKIRKLVRDLPLQSIVLETDAPDMSGAAHKGERNSPEFLPEALDSLAEIRNQSKEEIAQQTTLNANEVFRDAI
jgi:TatD DNase family protein